MIRATKVIGEPHWTGEPADTVVLEFDDRHRRRTVMTGTRGLAFLLDLAEAVMLRGGNALELEDGRLVEVVSAPETLIEVRGRAPGDLVRLAWHIGNRHLPAQVLPNAIRIRQDHVIEDMLRGLGAKLATIEAPFDPEGGAYATSHAHDHASGPHGQADHGHKHEPEHDGKHRHEHHGAHDHKHGHHDDQAEHGHGHRHGAHDH